MKRKEEKRENENEKLGQLTNARDQRKKKERKN